LTSAPHHFEPPDDSGEIAARIAGEASELAVLGAAAARLIEGRQHQLAIDSAARLCPVLAARCMGLAQGIFPDHDPALIATGQIGPILGADRVRAALLAILPTATLEVPEDLRERLIRASHRKAVAAQLLGARWGDLAAEQAATLGLVEDLGLHALAALHPTLYRPFPEKGELLAYERLELGTDHAQVGAALLHAWGVITPLARIVAEHHDPMPEALPRTLPERVACAARFAARLTHLPGFPDEIESLAPWYMRRLPERFESLEAFQAHVDRKLPDLDPATSPDPPRIFHVLRDTVLETVTNASRREAARAATSDKETSLLKALKAEAVTDPLTQLLNRRGLLPLANRRLRDASQAATGVCCLMLDLDNFKPLNDTHGHARGDAALRGVAKLLRRCFRPDDLVARIGGDEFVAVITGVHEKRARALAANVLERIESNQIRLAPGLDVQLHASIGAAFVPACPPALTAEALLEKADAAMYTVKQSGKAGTRFETWNMEASDHEAAPGEKTA